MTTTEQTGRPANAADCPTCHGKGHVPTWVMWSDGLGGTVVTCGLCDGAGFITETVEMIGIHAKREAAKLAYELRQLKTHVALYLSIAETGHTPRPPLADASRPARDLECWREYLHKAVDGLPRLTEAESCKGCRTSCGNMPGGLCPDCYYH